MEFKHDDNLDVLVSLLLRRSKRKFIFEGVSDLNLEEKIVIVERWNEIFRTILEILYEVWQLSNETEAVKIVY